ncbi:MOSC domain-containing protein [Rubrobacter taiwanensis]|uniref:MOSC domain-containing protein n=1 Tax=Rubrobacter taiwanensis TaxID=185139 RepID=A0A4V2NWR0_9ACTN|nr:MOSC domain-containing protein [Rubrobacter taiwanensis]TCJ18282.1 MOSC domain-containing protein [Rubrobacter taiwanensis]
MKARLVSLNVGKPRELAHGRRTVRSAIYKTPVSGVLWLGERGLEGDEQADLRVHGGPEKAVCVYPLENLPHWRAVLGLELGPGAFGENFSVSGMVEEAVHIGDTYRVGEAVVQVSQPRQPCFKLAARHEVPELALLVQESGRTGFYFRCLQPGRVRAGDELALLERPGASVSVAEANRIMHRDKRDAAGIERLLAIPELSASWRRTLEKRLGGAVEDAGRRLSG